MKKINRQRKSLEARSFIDEERIATLEKQLAEAQIIAEDADRRYDEVSTEFDCVTPLSLPHI